MQKNEVYYTIWAIPNRETKELHAPHTFSEIVERQISNTTDKFVLIDQNATHNDNTFVVMIRGLMTHLEIPVFIKFDSVNDVQILEKWFLENRQPRIFNLNPKHGENGTGARPNKGETVSLLRCNRSEAAELLNSAKGDKRLSKELFAYDAIHSRFIIFKDENTAINSYHGYHVDDENEIPLKVRNILRPKL